MITGNHMTGVFEVRLCHGASSRLEAVFDDEDLAREAAKKVEMRARGGLVVVQPGGQGPTAYDDDAPYLPSGLHDAAERRPAAQFALRGLLMVAVLACSSIFLL